jgi:Bacterial CdiA-CT RNAse A domain
MVGVLILLAALHTGVPSAADTGAPRRNLAVDEGRGGHTLARHVGRTDLELRDRLKREPHISAASSYVDRAAAELMVGLALDRERGRLESWERRHGSRPNLVLHVDAPRGPPIGRVLARGASTAVPAASALVVLRWDVEAGNFFVLTSYPEAQ